jgi:hypothetical protein
MVSSIGFETAAKKAQDEASKAKHALEMTIKDVDSEYHEMLNDLDAEKLILKREISLVNDIRKELVLIHKQIKEVSSLSIKRNMYMHLINATQKTNTHKALEIFNKLKILDEQIKKKVIIIHKELEKHELRDLSKVYEFNKLEKNQIAHIQEITQTLYRSVNGLANNSMHYQNNPYLYGSWESEIKNNLIQE